MEKETLNIIGGLLVIIMMIASLGIGMYSLYTLSSSKKAKKNDETLALDVNTKHTPSDNHFKKLWEDSGLCSFYDMDGWNSSRLTMNSIRKDSRIPSDCTNEEIYRDAIIGLMKDVVQRRGKGINNLELRKFCIERTTSMSGNVYRDTVGILRTADMLYNYILSGKIPENKKKE